MPNHALIDQAYDDLAHSLRILLEAHYHANRGGLLFVDRDEAIGNIETALSAVLNAFHSLHDSIEAGLGRPLIDWYKTGPLATILAIRNARHHNKANKIRTLYSYHARGMWRPDQMRQYVLIHFTRRRKTPTPLMFICPGLISKRCSRCREAKAA